jgi:hypothetical protein
VAGVLVAGIFLGRGVPLRGLGGLLIVDEPAGAVAGVVPLRGDRMHDAAAARVRDGGAEVLLIELVPLRQQAMGIVPTRAETDRQALEDRGVPESAIRVLSEETDNDWDAARVLHDWLREHPGTHVAVLSERFGSRRLRILLDRVLGADAGRVHVVGLSDRRYDETNWWRNHDGLAAWLDGIVGLGFVWLAGEGENP